VRDFRAWASIVSLVLVGAGAVSGHTLVLPGWAWALLATGCAFWIAWRAERERYNEKRSEIKCDTAIIEGVERIVGTRDFSSADTPQKLSDALLALREKAHLGEITIWGRRDVKGRDLAWYPLSKIEHSYWDEYTIDYLTFTDDNKGITVPERVAGVLVYRNASDTRQKKIVAQKTISDSVNGVSVRIYSDLHLSRHQIDKIWPPRAAQRGRFGWSFPTRQVRLPYP
jgi:hypothetical protein